MLSKAANLSPMGYPWCMRKLDDCGPQLWDVEMLRVPTRWTAVPWGKKTAKGWRERDFQTRVEYLGVQALGWQQYGLQKTGWRWFPITCPVNMNPSEWSEPRTMSPSHFESPERPFSHPDTWERKRSKYATTYTEVHHTEDGHHAAWNMTVPERQVLHASAVWGRKQWNSQMRRIKWWVPGAGGGGNERLLINGYKVSVMQDE